MKAYIQKQMISAKFGHLSLLFYKIFIPIYAFLIALRNTKNVPAVEVRFSSSQPASYGFLDCLVILVVVTSQMTFQRPENVMAKCGMCGGWERSSQPFHFPLYP